MKCIDLCTVNCKLLYVIFSVEYCKHAYLTGWEFDRPASDLGPRRFVQCTSFYQLDAPCSQDMAHGSQVEHMERKAELHSNAVGDLKQDPESGKKQQTQIQQKVPAHAES